MKNLKAILAASFVSVAVFLASCANDVINRIIESGRDGGSEQKLGSWSDYSDLASSRIPLPGGGTWEFTLTGKIYYDEQSEKWAEEEKDYGYSNQEEEYDGRTSVGAFVKAEIVEGVENSVAFNLRTTVNFYYSLYGSKQDSDEELKIESLPSPFKRKTYEDSTDYTYITADLIYGKTYTLPKISNNGKISTGWKLTSYNYYSSGNSERKFEDNTVTVNFTDSGSWTPIYPD